MQSWMEGLETPCVVIDVEKARANILRMQCAADAANCALRPHIKTHKMPLFARMQVEAGAKGITCAKVSEAEVMADGGIDDIFIAYPMVGDFRIRRAIDLSRRVRRLILAVDSEEGAAELDRTARREGVRLEVRLEIDTGAGRTGVAAEQAAELAERVAQMRGLELTGIYTFKGLVYGGKPCADAAQAAEEEGRMLADAARAIRRRGVELRDVSGGSTPTGIAVAQTGMVSEIRPGTYVFNDELLVAERAAAVE
ncbi:MAG: alanine racemase [Clostridia bacterium]|nr:alanine racemase [Clostridia bacterium]